MGENLLAEFVNKLIEAQVDLRFHLVVEKLFAEHSEGVVGAVIVQVQRVQHVSTWKHKLLWVPRICRRIFIVQIQLLLFVPELEHTFLYESFGTKFLKIGHTVETEKHLKEMWFKLHPTFQIVIYVDFIIFIN